MIDQITLDEALRLVDFDYYPDAGWRVKTVKGYCNTVEGYCHIVKGSCYAIEGNCGTVTGFCGTVEGNVHTVKGRVLDTINGRQWRFVESPKEKMTRLIKEGASEEELLKALEKLND